jgi:hypothetical protein
MSKYFLLGQYLQKSGKSSEVLTFAEIEKILGDSLPPSAFMYPEWWGNTVNKSHVQAKSWMDTGWRVDYVRLGQNVTFKRDSAVPAKSPAAAPAGKKERSPAVILIKKEALKTKTGEPEMKGLSEDEIKQSVKEYLEKSNWTTNIAWGRKPGIDIDASRGGERWIIEVKGYGSRNAMRVNYFLAVLGELLQRMGDSNAKYSIALPDLPQFRNLWLKLPRLTKQKTGITCLFVDSKGNVKEER